MVVQSYVHIIDADSRRRAGVSRDLLSQSTHAEVYEDLDEFVRAVPEHGAIFAYDDADSLSLASLRAEMRQVGRLLPVALYSDHPSPAKIVQAMREGAIDYLEWPFDLRLLNRTIDHLRTEGRRLVENQQRRARAEHLIGALSRREQDVLSLLIEGHSNKSMAENLNISPRTVEIHRANMMRKMRANTPSEAVRIALQAGFNESDLVLPIAPLAA